VCSVETLGRVFQAQAVGDEVECLLPGFQGFVIVDDVANVFHEDLVEMIELGTTHATEVVDVGLVATDCLQRLLVSQRVDEEIESGGHADDVDLQTHVVLQLLARQLGEVGEDLLGVGILLEQLDEDAGSVQAETLLDVSPGILDQGDFRARQRGHG